MDRSIRLVTPSGKGNLWAIVLAGGEGLRLRPLTRHLYGDERPKQYAAVVGARSLLRQTLDRVGLLVPAERTVVVTLTDHTRYVEAELRGAPRPHVLAQPYDRGTAAGVLLPAHWIKAQDPEATVVVFPSDHFVLEESAFMCHVADVARAVRHRPESMIILGAEATEPEAGYGWIEPGDTVAWTPRGPLRRVHRFIEKPPLEDADMLFQAGCLWNMFVFAARVPALIEAGRIGVPLLHDRLARLELFLGTRHEPWAIRQACMLAPTANFSRSVLEDESLSLIVSKVPDLTWCDLGTPERVARTLRRLGVSPAWLAS
ncbi:MAG TPA: sugar phosphate nucleotidyltransferase [Candidatus Bathyarchaeia archaeon]|nr:sugar phosphate nucleotidyltransferase [Candidatus Bathyarchaeia archaeon]